MAHSPAKTFTEALRQHCTVRRLYKLEGKCSGIKFTLNLGASKNLRLCAYKIIFGPTATLNAHRINPGDKSIAELLSSKHTSIVTVLDQLVVASYGRRKKRLVRLKLVSKFASNAGLLRSDSVSETVNYESCQNSELRLPAAAERAPAQTSDATTTEHIFSDIFSLYWGSSGVTSHHLKLIHRIKFYTLFPSRAWNEGGACPEAAFGNQ